MHVSTFEFIKNFKNSNNKVSDYKYFINYLYIIFFRCPIGFMHEESDDAQQCSRCIAAGGCAHGSCARADPEDPNSAKIPGTCFCDEGYTGPLCDQLQCR